MLVMSLLLLLLLPQGTGWLLLAMAHLPIGRTAENRMLASVAATKLLRQLKELLRCSISSSGMWLRKSSTKLPWSLSGCAIAGFVPVEWILLQIKLRRLSISMTWISCEGEWKSASRWRKTSVDETLTAWLMFLVSLLVYAPPPGPNSGHTLNWSVEQADGQWWMVVAVRPMNVSLILSINDLPFIPICHMP